MYINNKKPPKIINQGRPHCYAQLVPDAAHAVRLSKRATKLLAFYCDRSDGFTPALEMIKNETGIAANKVSTIRQELVDHGLIQYDSNAGYILIDWTRIRVFAMLIHTTGEPLSKKESLNSDWFTPVSRRVTTVPKCELTIGQLIRKHKMTRNQRLEETPPTPRKLTNAEETFFSCLESMTETEYAAQVMSMPEYQREEQKPIIEWDFA